MVEKEEVHVKGMNRKRSPLNVTKILKKEPFLIRDL